MTAPSKTAKNELDLVTQADILRDYLIVQNPAMGSEVEHIVTNDRSQLITVKDHDRLKDTLHQAGVPVSDEPLASIFEVKTKAHKSAAPLIAEMSRLNQKFLTAIQDEGYRPAQIGYLGNLTLKQAMESRIPSERADGLLEHFIRNGQGMCARQPLMTTSVHLSISYADIDHAYQMGKLLMVLTPALTALCENTGGVFDGKPCSFNPSATIRLSQQDRRGGLSPVIAAATSPQDMMERQAAHICTTPMMMHIDKGGTMRVTDEQGNRPALESLKGQKLNTRSNAMLSESMQYHMLKFTSLRDEFGRMTGKRLEIRMADNGPFQHDFMAVIGEAIGFNPAFRAALGEKLKTVGLDPFAPQSGPQSEAALDAVAADRLGAMEKSFGATSVGGVTTILLDLLEEYYRDSLAIRDARAVLTHGKPPVPAIYAP
ncbi:MAG: hypothetical protein ACXW4B_00230 [Micavibrio sp.]